MPSTPFHIMDLSTIIALQQEVVTADLELIELMKLICLKTQVLTNAGGAVVEMAEGEEMVYRATSGTLLNSLGVKLNIHSSLSGLAVKNEQVLYCEDSETDPRVNKEVCRKVGARSMICVPLIHKSRAVGVLKVISSEKSYFSEHAIEVLKLIAGLLSSSIAKASETDEKSKALKLLQESEALLRASEKVSNAATLAKSEFLANMSHEIRTPLNGVLGMAGLLSDSELSSEQSQYVSIIKSSAESLLILVNDILDFSKIEARKLIVEKIDFDLLSVTDDVRQLLVHQAKKKNLNLIFESDVNVPKIVLGDPTRIKQILLNLVNNAIKFTNHGSIFVKLKSLQEDQNILFEVTDQGIGIPEIALQQMFLPFSQADASTTRKFGGTGLGLSICKQLVGIMSGEIGVFSAVGTGSTFWFKLPLPVSTKKIVSSAEVKPLNSDKLRILVAEDNSVNQMIVRVMLEKMGHTITLVGNGIEAIEALELAPYDLILMDCQMPEMDGYQATKTIRSELSKKYKDIHIIAMTANALDGDREKCLMAGMNDYISKPMKKDDLIKVLNLYSGVNRV